MFIDLMRTLHDLSIRILTKMAIFRKYYQVYNLTSMNKCFVKNNKFLKKIIVCNNLFLTKN